MLVSLPTAGLMFVDGIKTWLEKQIQFQSDPGEKGNLSRFFNQCCLAMLQRLKILGMKKVWQFRKFERSSEVVFEKLECTCWPHYSQITTLQSSENFLPWSCLNPPPQQTRRSILGSDFTIPIAMLL